MLVFKSHTFETGLMLQSYFISRRINAYYLNGNLTLKLFYDYRNEMSMAQKLNYAFDTQQVMLSLHIWMI